MYIFSGSVSLQIKLSSIIPLGHPFKQFPLYKYLYVLSALQSYIQEILFCSFFIVYFACSGHWGLSKGLYSLYADI